MSLQDIIDYPTKFRDEELKMQSDVYLKHLYDKIMAIHKSATPSAIKKEGHDVRIRIIYPNGAERQLNLLNDELERYRKKEYPLHHS